RIRQAPFGMVLQSIRENEPRTRAIGYNVERYKIVAVMLSGLFAGLAGSLYAVQDKFAAPDFVLFLVSGETVIFNVMGGMGTLVGPVAGAAFFLLMKEAFSRIFYEYYLIPVGIIFTLIVIFLPQGLLGFLRRRLNQYPRSGNRSSGPASRGRSGISGRTIRNTAPAPGALRTSIAPPWSSMIFCVSASPSPVPASFVEKNGLKTRSRSVGAMPLPESSISMARRRALVRTPVAVSPPLQPTRSVSVPPRGIASSAFATRFTRAR